MYHSTLDSSTHAQTMPDGLRNKHYKMILLITTVKFDNNECNSSSGHSNPGYGHKNRISGLLFHACKHRQVGEL